jgi:hypothetical protein
MKVLVDKVRAHPKVTLALVALLVLAVVVGWSLLVVVVHKSDTGLDKLLTKEFTVTVKESTTSALRERRNIWGGRQYTADSGAKAGFVNGKTEQVMINSTDKYLEEEIRRGAGALKGTASGTEYDSFQGRRSSMSDGRLLGLDKPIVA